MEFARLIWKYDLKQRSKLVIRKNLLLTGLLTLAALNLWGGVDEDKKLYEHFLKLPSTKQVMIFQSYRDYQRQPHQHREKKKEYEIYTGYLEYLSYIARMNSPSITKSKVQKSNTVMKEKRKIPPASAIQQVIIAPEDQMPFDPSIISEGFDCENPHLQHSQETAASPKSEK